MARQDIVIVGAARTAGRLLQRRLRHHAGARARRRRRSRRRSQRAKVEAGRGRRGHPRPGPDRRPGPEPGPPGGDERRHAAGEDRLGPQPALRLGPARGRARHAADRQRRRRHHRRRRPGIDVAGAARRASARRHQDGRLQARRHHAQGRPDGRLQRLPHGQHGRERRRASGSSPARSRTSSPSPRRTRPRRRRRPAGSRTRSSPVTIKTRKGDIVVDQDEYIRAGTTHRRASAKLRPAFAKDGTVTAGNASGINDGAAAVVLMTRRGGREARPRRRSPASPPGRPPASIRRSWAPARSRPRARRSRRPAGRSSDLDLVEANEAFAAQALAVNKDMGWDPAIVNVNGGAIAIGHPIGASGARVLDHAAPRDAAAATPRRASPRCASAAAWASPCASSA